jgi:serpin B
LLRALLTLAAIMTPTDDPQDAPVEAVVRGNTRFALDLYGKLSAEGGNLFVSPYSISTALAMTYAGARGETADQMAAVLHLPPNPGRVHEAFAALKELGRGGDQLAVANRLWGQAGYHFLPEFLATTRESYGAELAEVDFARAEDARRRINGWVEEQTRGKIADLIRPGVLDPQTRLVLTNAIHFKGDWADPFPKAATRDAPFRLTPEESADVPLMNRRGSYRYFAGDGLKALELPYEGRDLAMLVLLPDEVGGLAALERELDEANLAKWVDGLKARDVDVALPRFRMASQLSLDETLKGLGMPLAFDRARADFSGMTTQEELFIWAVVHKAFVDVNEEGTEAAAATAVVMAPRSAAVPRKPAVFRADHPFVFAIRDTKTGSILFLGRVVDPRG